MGEAAKISLKAIGKQDTHLLSKDPDDSFFNYKELLRHSEFRKYHRSRNVVNPGQVPKWPFGQTLKVEFNPTNMGDLLSNMWLSITMPGITDGNYADQLGRHILKSVTMFVDDIEVEKLHDDWGIIYDELYLDASEKRTKRYTLNRNQSDNTSHVNDASLSRFQSELMIPIPLFFSRKYEGDEYDSNSPNRPYFPTCAIHKQNIEFEIKFRPMSFFTNNTGDLTLNTFNLITEEITVSPQERIYLMTKKQLFITDIAKKHPTEQTIIGENSIKLQLVPNIPVKSLFWFLRKEIYEDETAHGSPATPDANITTRGMSNRFNFSTASSYSIANSFLYSAEVIPADMRFFTSLCALPTMFSISTSYLIIVDYLNPIEIFTRMHSR